eukprot:scaffold16446_cov47-Phaeocystis_antarctica.AAC.1
MCAGVEAAENYRLHRPYRAWVRPIRHAAGAQPPHSEDGDEGHHFGELSPSFLQQTPRPPASCTAARRELSQTLGGTPGVVVETACQGQEISTATRGGENRCAGTLAAGARMTVTWL